MSINEWRLLAQSFLMGGLFFLGAALIALLDDQDDD